MDAVRPDAILGERAARKIVQDLGRLAEEGGLDFVISEREGRRLSFDPGAVDRLTASKCVALSSISKGSGVATNPASLLITKFANGAARTTSCSSCNSSILNDAGIYIAPSSSMCVWRPILLTVCCSGKAPNLKLLDIETPRL
ncbi:hypothetical protein [Methylocystis sp. H4A]|uniref:hypothetical protein n=1 Tax=Methylocystis sp. H4A TaxID=2785788 RepID=UPI001FEEF181|nr:hypothetical protein [Methylocystis sp. H4A]